MKGRGLITGLFLCLYIGVCYGQQGVSVNKAGCTNYVAIMSNAKPADAPIHKSILLWQGIVLLVCFGAFALFVSLMHRIVR